MSAFSSIVVRDKILCAVMREQEEWGIRTYDLAYPPRRFWADKDNQPPAIEPGVDAARVQPSPTPAELICNLPESDTWSAQSKRSLARLFAHYLICEDPQRRLDAREVITLSHQVSLVRHILDHDHLRRVMIADEVGLGKTVEAGLLVQELFAINAGLRVLYLAPARLVNNVGKEFDRLGLHFRLWKAGEADARLTDARVVASIHRAVHGDNFKKIVNTGPWDVIVVDECHHLSDWAVGGGDPVLKFRLGRDLLARQGPDCRLLLMSGTPHQGHMHRFDNLLRLLRLEGEPENALAGRVIYRTKEDVRDWNGNPLFPTRQINEPLVLDLGAGYKAWLQHIHDFYKPPKDATGRHKAQQRAAGWRCAQALQWAASSPQAGLGYLVRQAVRASWQLNDGVMTDALAALRPYRDGPVTEPLDNLLARIRREVRRQADDQDIEDLEDEDEATIAMNAEQKESLNELIVEGLRVFRTFANRKWDFLNENIIAKADGDKIVFFAQPIETVCALARYLEHHLGQKPAMIIGGQTDAERQQQQDLFWRKDGPRFLVSSRAGGEGINLQIARRLVHIDVPWNPMELEQRVGRVHRFGSKRTIIVDTIVVKHSREADAYRVAREKLRLVASTIVAPERFESIFSRVMCLISPEELQDVLIEGNATPLRPDEQNKIADMVESGFRAWREFHDRYAGRQREIRAQDPGIANWEDLKLFLQEHAAAENQVGFTASRFRLVGGEVIAQDDPVEVLRLRDGLTYMLGDGDGAPVTGPNGERVNRLGLNLPVVAELLRKFALSELATGAAHLRWPAGMTADGLFTGKPLAVFAFLRQTFKTDQRTGWTEQGSALFFYAAGAGESARLVEGKQKQSLIRVLTSGVVRLKPDMDSSLTASLNATETELCVSLRRPSETELRDGIRHSVAPIFVGLLTT
jgi:superfamily II DNA or RNA helicase